MFDFSWEFKHAVRSLGRSPVSTLAILATLGLGIGANLAIFSVVRATLVQPLPYERPDELMVATWEGAGGKVVPLSPAELRDVRRRTESFSGIAAYHPWTFNVTGIDPAERLPGAVVTPDAFDVLGVEPAIGRNFASDDTGTPQEVLLSHGLWSRRFGGDRSVVGDRLVLDGEPMTVVGVMPRGFAFPVSRQVELWRRAPYDPDQLPRQVRFLLAVARRAEGVPPAAATAELERVADSFANEYPDISEGLGVAVTPMRESVVRGFESNLLLLQAAVVLALVLACFNVAFLQLSRGEARRDEMAVRLALGASRRHVLRLSLWESLLLGLGGSILGVLVAVAGVRLVVRFGPADVHRLETAAVGGVELGLAVTTGLVCALVVGQVPFWLQVRRSAGTRPGDSIRTTARSPARQALVSFQVAVTVFLLLTCGLFLRSFQRLGAVDMGFQADGVLAMGLMLPEEYASLERSSGFVLELGRRLQALPGVEAVATAVSPPIVRGFRVDNAFGIAGRPPDPSGPQQVADIRPVSPGYFELLRIPVVAGRSLERGDDGRSRPVVVINRTLARQYFEEGDAVGQRLRTTLDYGATVGSLPHEEWEIVGVVGDVRQTAPDEREKPAIYVSTLQAPWMETQVLIETSAAEAAIASQAQEVVRELDPSLPVLPPTSLERAVREALGPARFQSGMLGVFAGFALLLLVVGLYGTLAYAVARRSREIGLRMALGAKVWQTRWLVIRQALTLVITGSSAGLAASLLTGGMISGLLFGIVPTDPLTYVGVSVVVFLTGVLACWLPARRATAIDPARSLQPE